MNLSMWIIKKWLSKYGPSATITEGRQTIEGVRFFTDGTVQNTRYAYISRVRDAFPVSFSDEVLLMHGNDVISLKSRDLEEVFNEVLEAFEFYNRWELRLQAAIASNTPEQDVIDACGRMLGPMFMMDLSLNLIAYSKCYGLGEVNFIWDDFIRYNNLSLATISALKTNHYSRLLPYKHDCLLYEEPTASPYSYGIMISYCQSDGELLGQLAIVSEEPMAECELQLAGTIREMLGQVRFKTMDGSSNSHSEGIFYNVVAGEPIDDYEMKKLKLLQEWTDEDCFCVAQAVLAVPDDSGAPAYRTKLRSKLPGSIVIDYENRLYVFLRAPAGGDPAGALAGIAAESDLRFGISGSFTDLMNIGVYLRQAYEAVRHCGRTNGRVCRFHSCALYAILGSGDKKFTRLSLHPAVTALVKYDAENHSDYAKTLRLFLQNERSFLDTAKALYVHRNTISYRIDRIGELCGLDLDSGYEREYLLASFRLLDFEDFTDTGLRTHP